MKSPFLIMAFVSIALFSCRKDQADIVSTSLDGKWKMIEVTDHSTNSGTTKPASLFGDVIINFVSTGNSGGVFNGTTPTNDLGPNTYYIGTSNTLFITSLGMTKVAETSWGMLFVGNIRDAQQYQFAAGNLLDIITINKTFRFQKI